MKTPFKFLSVLVIVVATQSCKKNNYSDKEVIKDHFNYATRFDFREDSIKVGNSGWEKIAKGGLFSWLATKPGNLQQTNFATYQNRMNIKTDFKYVIQKDSIFALRLASDTIYFLISYKNRRTDLIGQIKLASDTSLILKNMGISPELSIKYKLEKRVN